MVKNKKKYSRKNTSQKKWLKGYWEWKDGKIIATGGILDPTWYGAEIVRYLESKE